MDNPKKRLLSQASAESNGGSLAASTADNVNEDDVMDEPHHSSNNNNNNSNNSIVTKLPVAKRPHVEPRSLHNAEVAADLAVVPERVGAVDGGPAGLARYTLSFQNKSLLTLLRNKKREVSSLQSRIADLESRANAADTTSVHVNRAWSQLQSDLRVILRRLGESSAQQSQSASTQSLQSLGSFRRLLRSSSMQIASDDDPSSASQQAPAELSSHLRERMRESSDLLLAVVDAVERGHKSTENDKLIDELHAQLSAERERVASLVDNVAKLELQLASVSNERQQTLDDLTTATTQRDKARAALRSAQQAAASAAAAAKSGDGAVAGATTNDQAASTAATQTNVGVSNEELEDLRDAKADADKRAESRLIEIESMRRRYADLEATLNRERVDSRAALPDRIIERSELFQKLRQKQELSDAVYREKVAECERLQQALTDAERQRETGFANIDQQYRTAVADVTNKLRDSENALMRIRGDRRAITLRVFELETEVGQLKDTKNARLQYLSTLEAYTRSLAARLALARLHGGAGGVADATKAASASALQSAQQNADATTAATSALDQVVAASELASLQRELNDLRAKAALWNAQQSNSSIDALRDDLSSKLANAEANLRSAQETHSALEGELESVCQMLDDLQTQVSDGLAAIAAKEDLTLKLMGDKEKHRVAVVAAKEAQSVKQAQLEKLETVLSKQKAALDAKQDELRAAHDALEQRRLLIVELEAARDAANAVELRRIEEDASARARFEAANLRLDEAKRTMDEHVSTINEMSAKSARYREQVSELNRKLTAARAVNVGGMDDQVAYYREKLICKVCHDREKTTVISKCFHVFCGECVQQNLRDRHRKCPGCGVKFGEQDVHRLFLGDGDTE